MIQPVLDVIAENAARICGTPDVAIIRVEDEAYRVVAIYGSVAELDSRRRLAPSIAAL